MRECLHFRGKWIHRAQDSILKKTKNLERRFSQIHEIETETYSLHKILSERSDRRHETFNLEVFELKLMAILCANRSVFLWKATRLKCMEGYSTIRKHFSYVRSHKFKSGVWGSPNDNTACGVCNTPRLVRGISTREMLTIQRRSVHCHLLHISRNFLNKMNKIICLPLAFSHL